MKLSQKNRFRTVASAGASERLAFLAHRQYILLVSFTLNHYDDLGYLFKFISFSILHESRA